MIIVAIGLILLAGQLDVRWAWNFGRLWPIVFFVLGVGRLLGSREGWRGGFWFLFLGFVFMMHTYDVMHLQRSWPLFIVAGGVSFMFGDRRARDRDGRHTADREGPASASQTGRLP